MEIGEILPEELSERLRRGERPVILDVREPEEIAIASFPGATHIPMGEIPSRVTELDPDQETVVVCHHGIRSPDAAAWLRSQGVAGARSMAGGIDRWAVEMDASVPRY